MYLNVFYIIFLPYIDNKLLKKSLSIFLVELLQMHD